MPSACTKSSLSAPAAPYPRPPGRTRVREDATHGPAAGQHPALRVVGCAGKRSSRPPGANTWRRASGLALPIRGMGVTAPGPLCGLMNESRPGNDTGGARHSPVAVPWPRDVPRRGQSPHGQTPAPPPRAGGARRAQDPLTARRLQRCPDRRPRGRRLPAPSAPVTGAGPTLPRRRLPWPPS